MTDPNIQTVERDHSIPTAEQANGLLNEVMNWWIEEKLKAEGLLVDELEAEAVVSIGQE